MGSCRDNERSLFPILNPDTNLCGKSAGKFRFTDFVSTILKEPGDNGMEYLWLV